jgi:signal transduction histidine kinase
MKSIKVVLLVEDNPGDARLIREMFNEYDASDTELVHVSCLRDAESRLLAADVDLILLDLDLPDARGMEAVRWARVAAARIPVVVLTGMDNESESVEALHEGAQDVLIKGQIDTRGLLRAMRYSSERKRLEKIKNEFVATVSHELRTPLTSIFGSLGLLIGSPELSGPAGVRLLTIAHTNCQRLVRLVNDILDIEKLEAGQVIFRIKKVDVQSTVLQVIEDNRGFAEGHGVLIRFAPESNDDDVRADPDRLVQVLTNLLSNAIKFSKPSGEVVVAIEKSGDFVRVSVRDHGPGIPEEFKTHIFEKFVQADASQRGGTGLGLSIVKQIVDRLGGAIGFADAPGGGTIFSVDLPCWERRNNTAVTMREHQDAFGPVGTGAVAPINSIENARLALRAAEFDIELRRKSAICTDTDEILELRENASMTST